MKFGLIVAVILAVSGTLLSSAEAAPRRHHGYHGHHHAHHSQRVSRSRHAHRASHGQRRVRHTRRTWGDGRPHAWCGWWMRHQFGITDRAYDVARNWVKFGRAIAGPTPGAIGVMPHHVYRVVQVLGPGKVLAISGNDGNAVRTRERSTHTTIAWRMPN